MTGPTSFAPIIEMAITIVEQSGGQYHVLVIIADGQVHCFWLYLIVIPFREFSDQAAKALHSDMISCVKLLKETENCHR